MVNTNIGNYNNTDYAKDDNVEENTYKSDFDDDSNNDDDEDAKSDKKYIKNHGNDE